MPLAKKEFRGVVRYKATWLLVPLLLLWGYQPNYLAYDVLGSDITLVYLQHMTGPILVLGTLLLSYQTILKERSSGSLKFPLGLPLSRTDVLLGKIVGRTAGVGAIVLVADLLMAGIGLYHYGLFSPLVFVGMVVLSLVFVGIIVSIATAISTIFDRTITATAGTFLLYLPLFVLWDNLLVTEIRTRLLPISNGQGGGAETELSGNQETMFYLIDRFEPMGNFQVVTNWILDAGNASTGAVSALASTNPEQTVFGGGGDVVATAFDSVPFVLHEGFSVVWLVLWAVIPFAISWVAFTRGDVL